jgi:putative transposase
VGWDIFNSLDATNSLEVLKSAIACYRKPEIVNSDQGSQFTCSLWIEYLDQEEVLITMDGKGRAIDNIFIERLWRTVKQDYVYQFPSSDGTEQFLGLKKFFHFYNHEKSHQGIGRERLVNLYIPAA